MKVWAYLIQRLDESPEVIEQQRRQVKGWAKRSGLEVDRWIIDHPAKLDRGPPRVTAQALTMLDRLHSLDEESQAVELVVTTSRKIWLRPDLDLDGLDIEQAVKASGRKACTTEGPMKAMREKAQQRPSQSVAERLYKGRIAGAMKGEHQSGPAPYGYRRNKARRLVYCPKEAPIVRRIFSQYIQLGSTTRLKRHLKDAGVKTRRNREWSTAGLVWILRNETYLGRIHFADVRCDGKHRSLIAPIIFNKAGQLLEKNAKGGIKRRSR